MGASMKDVARLANVSTATVSHVINKTRNVNPETRERVLKAICDLHYNVNPVARNLRSGSSKIIGYVVSNLGNYFFMDIALKIDKLLSQHGYHLIYINSNEDPEKERDNIQSLLMQNVDGLIIAPVGQDCRYMDEMIGDRCPCVFFDREPQGFVRDVIMSTNFEGGYTGTETLIQSGYDRIGFIGSRYDETMHERIDGYRAALSKYGLSYEEDLICSGRGKPTSMSDEKSGDSYDNAKFLIEDKNVNAILAGNTLAMVGIFSYLNEKKYLIPEEFGIISFDDTFWLTMSSPSITAVKQDKQHIGQQVAETLLERIRGSKESYREYRIPTKLVLRNSTIIPES